MKFFIFTLLCFSLSAPAWAGDKKRNGGSLLSCGGQLEVLDLYEIHNSYGYTLKTPNDQNFQDILEAIFVRLEKHNPTRAQLYRSYLRAFEYEARFINDSDFTQIPDLGKGIPLPKDCKLVQAVAQMRNPSPMGIWYLFNNDLWIKLPAAQQAALVLHEFIYREAYAQNIDLKNSMGVRFFTGYLFSDRAENDSLKKYLDALKLSDLNTAEYRGFAFPLQYKKLDLPIEFTDDNTLKTVTLGHRFSLPGSDLLQDVSCIEEQNAYSSTRIQLHFDGDEIVIFGKCPMHMRINNTEGSTGYILARAFDLTPQGKIKKAVTYRNTLPGSAYTVHYQSSEIEFFNGSSSLAELIFSPQEQLAEIRFRIMDNLGLNNTYLRQGQIAVNLRLETNYLVPIIQSEPGILKPIH